MLQLLPQIGDLLLIALDYIRSKALFFSEVSCDLIELSASLLKHLNRLDHPLGLLYRLTLAHPHLFHELLDILLYLCIGNELSIEVQLPLKCHEYLSQYPLYLVLLNLLQ